MNVWMVASILYVAAAVITWLPVGAVLLRGARWDDSGPTFVESPKFTEPARTLLEQHDQRMAGTLRFWRDEAAKYRRLQVYLITWTILSAILVAVLIQVSDNSAWARALLTIMATLTAVLLALQRALRVEERYRGFRQGESDFYDLRRRLLDRPTLFGATEEQQLHAYFGETEIVRRLARKTETGNVTTVEEMRSSLWPGSGADTPSVQPPRQ
jgi:hypothetical protein